MNRILTFAVGSTLAAASLAPAAMIDLTTAGSSGTINGALFQTTNQQSTGTGVIEPFLRLQANGFEQAYNTSGSPLPFDAKPGTWTHDLQISDVHGVTIAGVLYAAFLLDINESNGGTNNFLSLDSVQIYTSPTPGQTTTSLSSLGTLRYDLDAGADNWVRMDASLSHGSGSGDLYMYVPASAFVGVTANDYLYLYTAFGTHDSSSAGFEEWSNFGGPSPVLVPTPSSIGFIAAGGLLAFRRRRSMLGSL
jgi:hypothetical protein